MRLTNYKLQELWNRKKYDERAQASISVARDSNEFKTTFNEGMEKSTATQRGVIEPSIAFTISAPQEMNIDTDS